MNGRLQSIREAGDGWSDFMPVLEVKKMPTIISLVCRIVSLASVIWLGKCVAGIFEAEVHKELIQVDVSENTKILRRQTFQYLPNRLILSLIYFRPGLNWWKLQLLFEKVSINTTQHQSWNEHIAYPVTWFLKVLSWNEHVDYPVTWFLKVLSWNEHIGYPVTRLPGFSKYLLCHYRSAIFVFAVLVVSCGWLFSVLVLTLDRHGRFVMNRKMSSEN